MVKRIECRIVDAEPLRFANVKKSKETGRPQTFEAKFEEPATENRGISNELTTYSCSTMGSVKVVTQQFCQGGRLNCQF